jgi:hypothetical protein
MTGGLVAVRALALCRGSTGTLTLPLLKEVFSVIISRIVFETFAHFADKLDATSFIVAFVVAV